MTWFSKYRFVLEDDDGNTRTVEPIIDDLSVSGEKTEKFNGEVKLADKVVFEKEDFEWIYARETQTVGGDQTRCGGLAFRVYLTCGGVETLKWQFFINMNECQWQPDQCRVTCQPQPVSEFTCVFRNWETELDVLDLVATKYEVPGLVGYLETETCGPNASLGTLHVDLPLTDSSCLADPADGWVILQNYWVSATIVDSTPGSIEYTGEYCTIWVRERVDDSPSEPPGDGWIDIGGDSWVREPEIYYYQDGPYYYNLPPLNTYIKYWVKFGKVVGASAAVTAEELNETSFELNPPAVPIESQAIVYSNGMLLDDVLEALVTDACPLLTIKSNFFQINADDPLPTDEPYPTAAAGFDKLMVWQASDVVRPGVSGDATDLKITLKRFLESLRNVFNVAWTIESGVFRVEHVSYFVNIEGSDFTLSPYDEYIEKKNGYSYISYKFPKVELFGYAFPTTPFFKGQPITYTFRCSDRSKPEQSWVDSLASADLGYLHQAGEDVPLTGLFFGAVLDGSGFEAVNAAPYYFAREDDDDGNPRTNGHLAFTRLLPNYWKWDRPKTPGIMNGVETDFETTLRLKKQEDLEIPVDCAFMDTFDPNDLVQTEMGWGEVQAWTYSAKKCLLTLTIVHE